MRVAFRVEGEPAIGLGHVMRCLALAQRLVASGHEVFFFMSQRSELFCHNRADWVGEILCITDSDKQLEPDCLVKQCTELKVNWLVLDGYQFEKTYRQSLQSNKFKLAVFDDMNNSGLLYADLVINGAPNATLHNYQLTAPNAQLAIGKDYQVLRQEFLQITNNKWSGRKNLTLMFGGSDPQNMTIKVLQSLCQSNASIPIIIITGAAYDGLQDLVDLIKISALDITHLHDCQNMAEVLLNTKLALSAAGGSQFELLACAVPAILVVVAENQKNASQDAASQGWCKVFNGDDLNADELAMQCISLLQQPELLGLMHKKALQFPVFDGAKNIVELMYEQKLTSDYTE
jgi:UDP-2,4-diacetamido-2,4,6-trideoxy-beta-L-altropyranose hydrolase